MKKGRGGSGEADAPIRFILSGNRSLEEFTVFLARISLGVFFPISGGNKLFVASQYKLTYETILGAGIPFLHPIAYFVCRVCRLPALARRLSRLPLSRTPDLPKHELAVVADGGASQAAKRRADGGRRAARGPRAQDSRATEPSQSRRFGDAARHHDSGGTHQLISSGRGRPQQTRRSNLAPSAWSSQRPRSRQLWRTLRPRR